MARKAKAPVPATIRESLYKYCLGCLPSDARHISIRNYKKNDLIELKRYEAFFRLYVTDELRASVRMNTVNCSWRFDDVSIFKPSPEEVERFGTSSTRDAGDCFWELADLGLAETLVALNEIPYAWEGQSWPQMWRRDEWLREWIPRHMMSPYERIAHELSTIERRLSNVNYELKQLEGEPQADEPVWAELEAGV